MDDLEICKRIAEIEGETIEHITHYGTLFVSSNVFEPYNPLTDDALCFQLMVKHKVIVQWLWKCHDGTPRYMAYVDDEGYQRYSANPNEAILLTIIAKTKGK